MLFKRSWMFVALLLPLAGLAFWRSYFSSFTSASSAFHVHGLTATLWVVLLAAQAWTIHNVSHALHRRLGKLSFFLFPVFMVGGVMILQSMAQGFASNRDPFIALHGARLGTFDVIAGAGFAIFYLLALLCRRNVELHSRYMLATALFLINPIIGRLMPGFVPGLLIRGLEDLPKFVDTVHYANLTAALIALFLYARAPRYGMPFLLAALLIGAQSFAFQFIGPMAWWQEVFVLIGTIPASLAMISAAMVGIALVMIGWFMPQRLLALAAAA